MQVNQYTVFKIGFYLNSLENFNYNLHFNLHVGKIRQFVTQIKRLNLIRYLSNLHAHRAISMRNYLLIWVLKFSNSNMHTHFCNNYGQICRFHTKYTEYCKEYHMYEYFK